jgi:hypothetical protein
LPPEPKTTTTIATVPPVTIVLDPGNITLTCPPLDIPPQTLVINIESGPVYPPADNNLPEWVFYLLAGMVAVILVLAIVIIMVIRKAVNGSCTM